MCIICSSAAGVRQPTEAEIIRMYQANPHGAGYMVARDGKVTISKGYMDLPSFLRAIRYEAFTAADPVVYHFRISTQAGVNPGMTHPFPLSSKLEDMSETDLTCSCGVAHNGIIQMTSTGDPTYSDTALFITKYLVKIVRDHSDLTDHAVHDIIHQLTQSRLAIMDGTGCIATIGNWIDEDGLLFSNGSYRDDYDRYGFRSIYSSGCRSHASKPASQSKNHKSRCKTKQSPAL